MARDEMTVEQAKLLLGNAGLEVTTIVIRGEKFLIATDADGCEVVRTPYTNGVLWSGADLIPAAIEDWKAVKAWKGEKTKWATKGTA